MVLRFGFVSPCRSSERISSGCRPGRCILGATRPLSQDRSGEGV